MNVNSSASSNSQSGRLHYRHINDSLMTTTRRTFSFVQSVTGCFYCQHKVLWFRTACLFKRVLYSIYLSPALVAKYN
jgi:hypothetical protein